MKECKVNNLVINNEKSRICVPVIKSSDIDIIEQIKSLQNKGIDLIELRIDCFENVNDDEALMTLSNNIKMINQLPIIFTLRTRNEGGRLEVEPRQYAHIIQTALASEAYEIYDIELLINDSVVIDLVAQIHERGKKVIMSNHDFNRTPSFNTMSMRFLKMASFDSDILKIAVTPTNHLDVLKILEFTDQCKDTVGVPVVVIAMGKLGALTRMTGSLFGSAITFAKVDQGSAPGQVDLEDLKTVVNILEKYS